MITLMIALMITGEHEEPGEPQCVRLFRCSANRRASLQLESGSQEDSVLLGLVCLGVADDLCTQ
jgi:hypothetical protein